MSVRTAEITMACALALMSIGIMFKSADGLSIGWVAGTGPGSGAWPFWLSAGMLIACVMTIVRWFKGKTPESVAHEPFMTATTLQIVGITVLALVALLVGTHIIGIYFSMMLFLLFYLRILGKHSWPLTLSLAIGTPIALFLFFEWALVLPLPKAYSEPLFYPIYDLIY